MRYPHPGGPDERRRRFEEVYAANWGPTQTAAAGPTFSPGPHQWIYTDVLRATASGPPGGSLQGPVTGRVEQKTWITGDLQQVATLKHGKLVITSSGLPRTRTGQVVMPTPIGFPGGDYAYLNSLPASPVRLMAMIKHNLKTGFNPIGADGQGNLGVFNSIQALMQNVVLPPRLLATLYGVLARDPVVHFERSVTDLAGRTGVGFSAVEDGYVKEQIVINPKTYAYMGYLDVAVRAHTNAALDETVHVQKGQILGWQAMLASGIVPKAGQLP